MRGSTVWCNASPVRTAIFYSYYLEYHRAMILQLQYLIKLGPWNIVVQPRSNVRVKHQQN